MRTVLPDNRRDGDESKFFIFLKSHIPAQTGPDRVDKYRINGRIKNKQRGRLSFIIFHAFVHALRPQLRMDVRVLNREN